MHVVVTDLLNSDVGGGDFSPNDFIGAFYEDVNGVWRCCGFTNVSTMVNLQVYGRDSTGDGPAEDQEIRLHWFSSSLQCVYTSVEATPPGTHNWTGRFKSNNTISIERLSIQTTLAPLTSGQSFCEDDGYVSIDFTGDVTVFGVTTSQGSLVLDSMSTGNGVEWGFYADSVDPGVYDIVWNTEECLSESVSSVQILEPIECNRDRQGNILAPEADDPMFHVFELDYEGEVKILNSAGLEVRNEFGPFDWDGTDAAGNLLPPDEYYIVLGESKAITIQLLY